MEERLEATASWVGSSPSWDASRATWGRQQGEIGRKMGEMARDRALLGDRFGGELDRLVEQQVGAGKAGSWNPANPAETPLISFVRARR